MNSVNAGEKATIDNLMETFKAMSTKFKISFLTQLFIEDGLMKSIIDISKIKKRWHNEFPLLNDILDDPKK